MKLRFAVPLVWVAFTAATPSGQPQRFALAIVRLDGAIVPFAAFNGGQWERAWPEADEATESAGTIDGTPSVWSKRGERVPRVWTVWPATGARSIQAQVTGIQVADAHCGGHDPIAAHDRSNPAGNRLRRSDGDTAEGFAASRCRHREPVGRRAAFA